MKTFFFSYSNVKTKLKRGVIDNQIDAGLWDEFSTRVKDTIWSNRSQQRLFVAMVCGILHGDYKIRMLFTVIRLRYLLLLLYISRNDLSKIPPIFCPFTALDLPKWGHCYKPSRIQSNLQSNKVLLLNCDNQKYYKKFFENSRKKSKFFQNC